MNPKQHTTSKISPPLLSVVSITRNDAVGIQHTIESVRTLRESGQVEQVVVDGSDLPAHVATEPAITKLMREPKGVANAFNEGVAASKGRWIWFLNGGDRMDPGLSSKTLLSVLETTSAEIVVAGTTYEGEGSPRPLPRPLDRWPLTSPWIPHPSTLIQRSLFEKYGGFDESYAIGADYEWLVRVTLSSVSIDIISIPLAIFAPGGMSQVPQSRNDIQRENKCIARTHSLGLLRSWLRISCRLLVAVIRMLGIRRPFRRVQARVN